MWSIEQLQSELERRRQQGQIRQYVIESRRQKRREYYYLGEESVVLDQARLVEQRQINVHVNLERGPRQLGSAHKFFSVSQDLRSQVDSLIGLAKTATEEMWEVPPPQVDPDHRLPELMDPALKEDFLGASDRLAAGFQDEIKSSGPTFNSAELFVSSLHNESIAANGFRSQSERTRLYAEVCFSATMPSDPGRDVATKTEEMLLTTWGGHPSHVDFSELCSRSLEEAKASLRTELPPSGTYSVLVRSDVLSDVFHAVLWQLNGHQNYLRMPFLETGKTLVNDFSGEPYEIHLDPTLSFGMASQAYSQLGFPQRRLLLMKNNEVVSNIYDARIAQYQKKSQTTSHGNLVIEAAGSPVEDLRRADDKVLEVLQFSGLFTDPLSLTFSSEIRLGRLFDRRTGEVKWIKGGNLSGNLRENLRRVRWSKERSIFAQATDPAHPMGYSGPAFALLSDVSVSS